MSLITPKTSGGGSVAALLYDDVNGKVGTLGAASVPITLPAACTTVTLTSSGNCWYKVGTAASPPTAVAGAAGNDYLAAGVKWTRMVPANCIIAVIQDGASAGTLTALPALDIF